MLGSFCSRVGRISSYGAVGVTLASNLVVSERAYGQGSTSNQIHETLSISSGVPVSIESLYGSLTVTEWDRGSVEVRGVRGRNAKDVRIDEGPDGVEITVLLPLHAQNDDTRLDLKVPRGTPLFVETLDGSVTVHKVTGAVQVSSDGGRISVEGSPEDVVVETVSGEIVVKGSRSAELESVEGTIRLLHCQGRAFAETASGGIEFSGGQLEEVYGGSISGSIVYRSGTTRRGALDFENASGAVTLSLDPRLAPDLQLETTSGQIRNDLGSTGSGGPRVSVKTESGRIVVQSDDPGRTHGGSGDGKKPAVAR